MDHVPMTLPMALPMARVRSLVALTLLASSVLVLSSVRSVMAADDVVIVYKDEKFTPDKIEVEAGKDFIVRVKNEDSKPIEFESNPMKIEKIVAANKEALVKVRGLKPGTYEFINEFNEKAKGTFIAK